MNAPTMSEQKYHELLKLIRFYRNEVYAIEAIAVTWEQLGPKAQEICAKDFDEALIARETLIEELLYYKDLGLKVAIDEIDMVLAEYAELVYELYGMDVKRYFGVNKLLPP